MILLYNKVRSSRLLNTFVMLTRYLVGFAFIPSGLVKLFGHRFTQLDTSDPVGFSLKDFTSQGITGTS